MLRTMFASLLFAVPAARGEEPSGKLTPLQQSARTVVKAIVARGEINSKLPERDAKKLVGDALTCEYLKVAAEAAAGVDEMSRTSAFLIGVGIALDQSP